MNGKQILSLLLSMALLLGLAGLPRAAAEELSGTCGKDGDNLTWTLSEDGVLTISGTGEMANGSNYGALFEDYAEQIRSIVIEEGVTSVGNYAFEGCKNLTELRLPEGLKSIAHEAFYGCTGLTELILPKTLEYINGFSDCESLVTVFFPEGLKEIGNGAFCACTGLTSLDLPESLKGIDGAAFSGCTGLTELDLPENLKYIGRGAFRGCTGLTGLTLPEGLLAIGDKAFSGCESLMELTLPGSLVWCADEAFAGLNAQVRYSSEELPWPDSMLKDYDGALRWVDTGLEPTQDPAREPAESELLAEAENATVLPPEKGRFEPVLAEPEAAAGVLFRLGRGSSVKVLAESGDYAWVMANQTRRAGWICKASLGYASEGRSYDWAAVIEAKENRSRVEAARIDELLSWTDIQELAFDTDIYHDPFFGLTSEGGILGFCGHDEYERMAAATAGWTDIVSLELRPVGDSYEPRLCARGRNGELYLSGFYAEDYFENKWEQIRDYNVSGSGTTIWLLAENGELRAETVQTEYWSDAPVPYLWSEEDPIIGRSWGAWEDPNEEPDWSGLTAIWANAGYGYYYLLGLRLDGSALYAGEDYSREYDGIRHDTELLLTEPGEQVVDTLAPWHLVLLQRSDGTVRAALYDAEYYPAEFIEEIESWIGVEKLYSQGGTMVLALHRDGTLSAACKDPKDEETAEKLRQWTEVKKLYCESRGVFALRRDGTVLQLGGYEEAETWTDITELALGDWSTEHLVGLRSDGTVLACGKNDYGQCEVSGWRDVVKVYAGDTYTLGLNRDGEVLIAGCIF